MFNAKPGADSGGGAPPNVNSWIRAWKPSVTARGSYEPPPWSMKTKDLFLHIWCIFGFTSAINQACVIQLCSVVRAMLWDCGRTLSRHHLDLHTHHLPFSFKIIFIFIILIEVKERWYLTYVNLFQMLIINTSIKSTQSPTFTNSTSR